jgi:2-alkenal reductase
VPFESQGAGSGFVYDAEHIVTNNHVTDGARSIEVLFYDGQRREGTLVGSDVYADLAVVRVDDMPDTARVLPMAQDLASLKVGQPVVAIGNPFEKANSMTYGIVSAVGRTIPGGQTSFSIPEAIQTDAAINPGNSGGPLLDLRGEVVGVNAQINTSNIQSGGVPANSGVGFAIPASVVNRVVPALIRSGQYEWPYLGVSGGSLSLDEADAAGLADTRGAYIQCVPTGGPSDGILHGSTNIDCATQRILSGDAPVGGDIVVAVDGQPVTSFEDLLSYIGLRTEPGQEVRLTVLRDGNEQDVTVRLGRRSEMQEQQ